jgi:hypothetical protein
LGVRTSPVDVPTKPVVRGSDPSTEADRAQPDGPNHPVELFLQAGFGDKLILVATARPFFALPAE